MVIKTIDAHTMGEPLRAVVEGLPVIAGNTMFEKQEYFRKNYECNTKKSVVLDWRMVAIVLRWLRQKMQESI